MKQAIIKKGPRMVLYSAHDTTLLSLATALNFTNINCLIEYFYEGKNNSDVCINAYPPFASNFIIELWEEDNYSHTIKVKHHPCRFYTTGSSAKYRFAATSIAAGSLTLKNGGKTSTSMIQTMSVASVNRT